jgi:hypothetical protein
MLFALFAAGAAHAQGLPACTDSDPSFPSPAPGDAVLVDGFAVEGKVSCGSVGPNWVMVNGAALTVPAGVLVNTRDPREGRKDIQWQCLVNPTSCFSSVPNRTYTNFAGVQVIGPLSIVGGTIKGNGTVLYTPPPAGSPAGTLGTAILQAINGTAEEPGLTFEFGEHLLIGVFNFEGPAGNPTRLLVNGQEFRMNDDPRMPLYPVDGTLMDIGGEPITIADLAQEQFRGTLIAVGGYFAKDATGKDILWGTSVETEAFAFNPNGDTIAIERAQYRTGNRLLRVDGSVVSPDGIFPTLVRVFQGTAAGAACAGTQLQGTAAVSPADGTFSYRVVQPVAFQPVAGVTRICVESPDNGASDIAISIRN